MARLLRGFFKSSSMDKHQFCNSKVFLSFFKIFLFTSRSYRLYHYLLKHCFTLCCFSVFLSNQISVKYFPWGKNLLKIILPLYMSVFQSIGTCPKVVFNKCIMILFIFLIQEVVLHLYLNSCCFLLLVQKLSVL